MEKRHVEHFDSYTLFSLTPCPDHLFITASVQEKHKDITRLTHDIYNNILPLLESMDMGIVLERVFGSLDVESDFRNGRLSALREAGWDTDSPYTFIEGQPCFGTGLAGVQIRAIRPSREREKIKPIKNGDQTVGRTWRRNGATFMMLQNIQGNGAAKNRYEQTCQMFDHVQNILNQHGAGFKNVLRTWIYLDNILDWYDVFNKSRNTKFTEFGLLGASESQKNEAERIYLPASTGIRGQNPAGTSGAMDVFVAIPNDSSTVHVEHTAGVQQRSPYRYGSAFSRAMTLREHDSKHILLSGTASINEQGKTVFIDNPAGQIEKTFSVVEALISDEDASLEDICEATVFFKNPQDYDHYQKYVKEKGLADLPAVYVIADVCRDNLLFEIDAAISFEI